MTPAAISEAAVLILLGAAEALEVLMVRRNPAGPVMPGVWTFPGGRREPGDTAAASPATTDGALRATAVRECAEETAIAGIDPGSLIAFAHWITPPSLPVRFDTRFYLARAPVGQRPHVDGVECVDAAWLRPSHALLAADGGSLPLLRPTRFLLAALAASTSPTELLDQAAARSTNIAPVRPRLTIPGDVTTMVLPGEPGYATAPG
jgi:8-oxo-dGTP pyrophosphatase MutT (NUDIX family)